MTYVVAIYTRIKIFQLSYSVVPKKSNTEIKQELWLHDQSEIDNNTYCNNSYDVIKLS